VSKKIAILSMISAVLWFSLLSVQASEQRDFAARYPEGTHDVMCHSTHIYHSNLEGPFITFNSYLLGELKTGQSVKGDTLIYDPITKEEQHTYSYTSTYTNDMVLNESNSGVIGFSLNVGKPITFPFVYVSTTQIYDVDKSLLGIVYFRFDCPTADAPGTVTVINTNGADIAGDKSKVALSDPKTVVEPQNTSEGLEFVLWDAEQTGKTFRITPEQINAVPAFPESNTLIASSEDGYYRFYRLSTGELQLNTGPDFEGKEFVTIFNAGGQVVRTYTIDPQ
jgi:WD40 repeat protein